MVSFLRECSASGDFLAFTMAQDAHERRKKKQKLPDPAGMDKKIIIPGQGPSDLVTFFPEFGPL